MALITLLNAQLAFGHVALLDHTGFSLETNERVGLIDYAVAWPWAGSPAWILALWWAFALSIVPLLGYLHRRLLLAAVFGAIGGPLAYLGAARGWHVVQFAQPQWHSLLALAAGWAVAMPLLAWLARREPGGLVGQQGQPEGHAASASAGRQPGLAISRCDTPMERSRNPPSQ